MSKQSFFHGTPNDISIYIEEYDKRVKAETEAQYERLKYGSWLQGLYIRSAVASVLSKRAKYPKRPYGEEDNNGNGEINCTEDMSEEQKQDALNRFFGNLEEMQKQFERTKGTGKD